MTIFTDTYMRNCSQRGSVSAALFWLNEWRGRVRWRKSLTRLTEWQLDDIGLLSTAEQKATAVAE